MKIAPESPENAHDAQWENALNLAKQVEEITGERIEPEDLRNMTADQVAEFAMKAINKLKGMTDADASEQYNQAA